MITSIGIGRFRTASPFPEARELFRVPLSDLSTRGPDVMERLKSARASMDADLISEIERMQVSDTVASLSEIAGNVAAVAIYGEPS